MRVLVVSQYFWPENFRINDLCAELVNRGHEVTVLTGKPNYPEGEVYPDYLNRPSDFKEYAGCKVVRVPMVARGQGSSVKLMLNYLTYALSATLLGAWKLKGSRFDVIFVFEPSPVTVGLPAVFLKKIKKAPMIFWVQDLWPDTLKALGVIKSPRVLGWVGQLVSYIYNRSDLVLGQSKSFVDAIAMYCKDRHKIRYFPNWSEEIFTSEAVQPVEDIIAHKDCFKVLFAGNVGEAQDFGSILETAKYLKQQNTRVKFFIVGDGRALGWVKDEVAKHKLSNIILLGRHPLELMPSFLCSADALLVTLKDDPVFSKTIPGKVQAYMSAGKPILTMLTGEGSQAVSKSCCGYVANSGDYETLAKNIIRMSQLSSDELRVLSLNAKRYSDKEFSRDLLIKQLEDWFVELQTITGKGSGDRVKELGD